MDEDEAFGRLRAEQKQTAAAQIGSVRATERKDPDRKYVKKRRASRAGEGRVVKRAKWQQQSSILARLGESCCSKQCLKNNTYLRVKEAVVDWNLQHDERELTEWMVRYLRNHKNARGQHDYFIEGLPQPVCRPAFLMHYGFSETKFKRAMRIAKTGNLLPVHGNNGCVP